MKSSYDIPLQSMHTRYHTGASNIELAKSKDSPLKKIKNRQLYVDNINRSTFCIS